MIFNLGPSKQADRKKKHINHPPLFSTHNFVKSTSNQKHLGMVSDAKLDFEIHLQNVFDMVSKTIGLPYNLS